MLIGTWLTSFQEERPEDIDMGGSHLLAQTNHTIGTFIADNLLPVIQSFQSAFYCPVFKY